MLIGGTGSDTIVAGTGNATMAGGAGVDIFGFFKGNAGGSDVIVNFASGDLVALVVYGQELAADLAAQQTSAAGTMLTVSDRTTIFLQGAGALTARAFLSLP